MGFPKYLRRKGSIQGLNPVDTLTFIGEEDEAESAKETGVGVLRMKEKQRIWYPGRQGNKIFQEEEQMKYHEAFKNHILEECFIIWEITHKLLSRG